MAGRRSTSLPAPDVCPVCGEEVPRDAVACPECGADHHSGWREDAGSYDALPDESFDYEGFIAQEFGSSLKPAGIKTIWWVTAILIVVALIVTYYYAAR